jgi:hypothetical protein
MGVLVVGHQLHSVAEVLPALGAPELGRSGVARGGPLAPPRRRMVLLAMLDERRDVAEACAALLAHLRGAGCRSLRCWRCDCGGLWGTTTRTPGHEESLPP